jgi:predicted component of type VI protein secretion system
MKVSLVVASGAHQGKVIAIMGPQFLIGRDPECHLRPASQAVSKQHCGFLIRDGKFFLKDYGSTNGTTLNDTIVRGEERQLSQGDSVKVGPLDFTVRIELEATREDGTPLPDVNPETAAALAAIKAATTGAPSRSPGVPTPMPRVQQSKPGSKEAPALKPGSKEAPALKPASKEAPAPKNATPAPSVEESDHDRIAAMLLGLNDEPVPEGSTVVEMPAVNAEGQPVGADAKADDKKDPKKIASREDTSNAASEILRKYMRRPK